MEELNKLDTQEGDEFGKVDGESNIVRCVRTICKSLAKDADPKNWHYRDWKTFCTAQNNIKYINML